MNFEFTEEETAFLREIEIFLEENYDPEVMDVTRENMAQVADTPKRRAFMKTLAKNGWLGITWPKKYGGQGGEGFHEYLLNEKLSSWGAPQIGKGVGIIGKTLINVGSEKLKREFLPQILNAEIEFAVGYSEPNAGSDSAAMRLKAERQDDNTWLLNGQKIFTTSAHFADWYWVGARTDPHAKKHNGISLFLLPMSSPGLTIHPMYTMGGERTNAVFFDDVVVDDDYMVGEENKGFQYIAEALDIERFTLFTFSPIRGRLRALCDYVKTASRNGKRLRDDRVIRHRIAELVTECEVANLLGVNFVTAATEGKTPTYEASAYKLYATELSRRLADATMNILGPGAQLASGTEDAPLKGRAESCYTFTVIDTIGGGSSEVQKNIIAKRKLGLPKTF